VLPRSAPAQAPQLIPPSFQRFTEPKVDPFVVEQLYLPNPAIQGSAAFSFATTVNGSHEWPLTGTDPTGRRLVTHDVDWTKRVVSFWNTYAGMGLQASPEGRQCY
jgi:hypothetical protein